MVATNMIKRCVCCNSVYLKRVKSFLARHKDNSKISDEFKGEPYKDKGYVAYNLWGGESMRTWVNKFLDKLES